MALAVPEWTRQWHKFLVERIGIDSLQLGLLLLMLLSLLTLLLSIMSVSLRFCCCPKRSAGRCRRRKPTGAMPSRMPTNGFTGTNEERRCLLQPNGICAVAVSSRAPQQAQQQLEKKAEPNFEVDHQAQHQAVTEPTVGAAPPQPPAQFEKSAIVADPVKASLGQIPLALTPRGNLPPSHPAHFSVESPPPPRRFASSGGRTQVLPLTSQNRRRVPPLVMLMAEQQQQQLHHRQQMMARGRMPTTPDSRATTNTTTTTGGMKSCATIPEDPEETNHRPLADELLSIDRTFVSADDEEQQQEEEVNRFIHRLPLHQPPPTFEVQPPTYSPPEPPNKMMPKNFGYESNNLSSTDRSSYGAQTSLNTTTGSSDESITTSSIVVVVVNRRNVVEEEEVRISELESETGAPPALPLPAIISSNNGVGWCHAGTAFAANGAALPPGHAAIVQHHRVPRSISQQLELMNMTTQS